MTLSKQADKFESSLTSSSDQSSDVCGGKLADEIVALKSFLPDTVKQPLDILKYLSSKKSYTAFRNYFVALRIFLTIPITVVSGERSFSCFKLIKNYLRSTMHQDRLYHLAIIAIERDLSRKQNFDTILHGFATRKARKVRFF